MDGGGLTVDERGRVSTTWRREGTVYTTLGDAPEEALSAGRNPTTVATRAGTTVAWTDDGKVRVRGPATAETRILGEGAFPTLAVLSDGSPLIAWEGRSGLQVLPLQTDADHTDASTR